MTIINDIQFAEFLTNTPLYYKLKAVDNFENGENNFSNPLDFEKKAFRFKCPAEKEVQTFRTKLWVQSHHFGRRIYGDDEKDELPLYFDQKTKKLEMSIFLHGVCQSCEHKIDFLIKATSDKSWEEKNAGINIYLQKIGQFPGYEIEPEISVQKYLTDEDVSNYKKALINLSISYGIGAYAYFRRIIENEIKRIIKDIAELDFDGVEYVRHAYKSFENDHQMSKLIDVVNKYLPLSLQQLGDNPIRLLYEQLSGGIHQFTEKECVERAKQIDVLLKYVIKKVNEEKYQLRDVRDAMTKLRANGN